LAKQKTIETKEILEILNPTFIYYFCAITVIIEAGQSQKKEFNPDISKTN
jgi:hypothetical protein